MNSPNLIVFDDSRRNQLLPFTFTRPAADIRCGIFTIREKWEQRLQAKASSYTQEYLRKKYPLVLEELNCWINGRVMPDESLVAAVRGLEPNESLWDEQRTLLALLTAGEKQTDPTEAGIRARTKAKIFAGKVLSLENTWDIFQKNGQAIQEDFEWITRGRFSQAMNDSNRYHKHEWIFLEEGAQVNNSVLNATNGPIYIGRDAEVMDGCLIRGPFVAGTGSVLKMGTKIYGATTLGPHCKVGGEVNNSVIFGYSNKAHDGFLGNAVLGEWCNLGADTNNSNLKNDYAVVKVWNYATGGFESSGTQFCGLMMGDHSKCGINTMFNTGTVVGVSANVFGAGFPRNFIPSFSWGGASGMTEFKLEKALEVAGRVMERRNQALSEADREIFAHIYQDPKR